MADDVAADADDRALQRGRSVHREAEQPALVGLTRPERFAEGAGFSACDPITGEGLPNPAPHVTRNWGELPAGRKFCQTQMNRTAIVCFKALPNAKIIGTNLFLDELGLEVGSKEVGAIAPFSEKTETKAQHIADTWLAGMLQSYGPERFEVLTSRTFVL